MHLDVRNYAALIGRTMDPNEARALTEHLDGECAQCERFLAERATVDVVDGLADSAIALALPPAAGAGNDVEFARIMRAVGGGAAFSRRWLLTAAVAASLFFAGLSFLVARQLPGRAGPVASWDGIKGLKAQAIPVRLRFLELQDGGAFQKGISGERVSASSSLVFEVEAGRASDLVLVRVSHDGVEEILWRSRAGEGRKQVSVEGRPAAYPLGGLSGPQRFVLIANESPIDDARARAAAAALAPPLGLSGDAPVLDGLSLDVVEVSVR